MTTVPNAHIKKLSEVQLTSLVFLVVEQRGEWVDMSTLPHKSKREVMRRLVGYGYAEEDKAGFGGENRGAIKYRSTAKGRKRLLDPEKLIP